MMKSLRNIAELLRLGVPVLVSACILPLPLSGAQTRPAQPEPDSQQAGTTVAASGLPVFGINLAANRWFVSTTLSPEAPIDRILAEGKPINATTPLRTDPGERAVLFTIVETPRPPEAMGAEIIIGDVDGNDETFFNGVLVGRTLGWGVADTGIPRCYHVPAERVKAGANILAVRLHGIGGRGSFGIRREPVVFGFTPTPPVQTPATRSALAPGAPAISDADARAAIVTLDPDTSAPQALMRKRPSFGRFGRFLDDGLPAVSEVSPTHVANRNGARFELDLDQVDQLEIASGRNEAGIDGWHKLTRVEARCGGKSVVYTALQHVLYPGAVYTLEKGRILQMRIRTGKGQGIIQQIPEEDLKGALPEGAGNVTVFAVYEPGTRAALAILAAAGLDANVTRAENRIEVTLSRAEQAKAPGKIFIFYPAGLREVSLAVRPGGFAGVAAAADATTEPAHVLHSWLRLGLNEPTAVDEYFSARPDTNIVRIYQLSRYALPAGVNPGPPVLFLPPQVSFAREFLKYPVANCPSTTSGLLTFSGFAHTPQSTFHDPRTGLHVVSYDLPIPPMGERGYIGMMENDELRALLNASANDLGSTTSQTAMDALYKSRTQGFQSFTYLSPDNRARLLKNSEEVVPHALGDTLWYETTEPLSGLRFWWTYFIEGPRFDRYDQDWGNGLSLVGLYTYAKYTGAWQLVSQKWDAVERMFSWFAVTDDWEWMRASNGIHGFGTGAGDCQSATCAGALAYARLAKGVGRVEDHAYGLYTAARAAVFTLNRFVYNEFADTNGLKQDNALVVGFHEGKGFLVGELDKYAWNVTSNISGNGIQPENFDLYVRYAPQALREYETVFEKAYPDWADGAYKYPWPTLYRDNSGYITLPHLYLRARLEMGSQAALMELVESARFNNYLWWLAPPVLAEIIGMKSHAYVAEWGRCAYLGSEGSLDEKKNRRWDLSFDNRYSPDIVQINLPRQPTQVQINDGPIPLTDIKYDSGVLTLRLRRPGPNKVSILYERTEKEG